MPQNLAYRHLTSLHNIYTYFQIIPKNQNYVWTILLFLFVCETNIIIITIIKPNHVKLSITLCLGLLP